MTLSKLIFGILLVVPMSALAEESSHLTFGVGAGTTYSGIGFNAGINEEEDSYLVSLGCYSYSDQYGSSCGGGVSWQSSALFNDTNKHVTSLYLGIVDSELVLENESLDNSAIYGAAVGYLYYPRGKNDGGFNFGASLSYGDAKRDSETNISLQLGYQF